MCKNHNYRKRFDNGVEKTKVKIKEHPITSIAIASGIGFGIGIVTGMLSLKIIEGRK